LKKGLKEKVYSKSFILDITSTDIKQKINTLVDELNESLKEENKEIRK
jgi:nucleoid DNA-binding protein